MRVFVMSVVMAAVWSSMPAVLERASAGNESPCTAESCLVGFAETSAGGLVPAPLRRAMARQSRSNTCVKPLSTVVSTSRDTEPWYTKPVVE